ncbi:hypothetical protein LINPERHAP1_LOCUS34166 [Linum perenne]
MQLLISMSFRFCSFDNEGILSMFHKLSNLSSSNSSRQQIPSISSCATSKSTSSKFLTLGNFDMLRIMEPILHDPHRVMDTCRNDSTTFPSSCWIDSSPSSSRHPRILNFSNLQLEEDDMRNSRPWIRVKPPTLSISRDFNDFNPPSPCISLGPVQFLMENSVRFSRFSRFGTHSRFSRFGIKVRYTKTRQLSISRLVNDVGNKDDEEEALTLVFSSDKCFNLDTLYHKEEDGGMSTPSSLFTTVNSSNSTISSRLGI